MRRFQMTWLERVWTRIALWWSDRHVYTLDQLRQDMQPLREYAEYGMCIESTLAENRRAIIETFKIPTQLLGEARDEQEGKER